MAIAQVSKGQTTADLRGARVHLWAGGIDLIAAAEPTGDYPAVQYVPPTEDYWIDILGRLGEAWKYPDVECEILRVEGVLVAVATPRTLYRMTRDTVRPPDRLDAQAIKQRFGLEDD